VNNGESLLARCSACSEMVASLPRRLQQRKQRTCAVRHCTSGLTETRRKSLHKISSLPRTNAINSHRRREIPTKCGTRFLPVDRLVAMSLSYNFILYPSAICSQPQNARNRQPVPVYFAICTLTLETLVGSISKVRI